MTGRGDKCRAAQHTIGIEDNILLQKIVVRISIDQRRDIHDHESFLEIGDINERVEQIDRLFLVLRNVLARGIERECARQRHRGREWRVHISSLAERRNRRGHDALGKSFLIDFCYVEYFETTRAVCRVEILAPQDNVLNVFARMLVRFLQLATEIDMFLVVGRVSNLMEITANHRLRFVRLGPDNGVKSVAAFTDVGVTPKEINRAGAEA